VSGFEVVPAVDYITYCWMAAGWKRKERWRFCVLALGRTCSEQPEL